MALLDRRTFVKLCAKAAATPAAWADVTQRPGTKQVNRPNILWLMTDEQRPDSLGCYGSAWAKTPALDAVAKRGTVFATAITPSPVCMPARTCVLTGRYPHGTGIWHNTRTQGIDADHLLEPFHAAGYRSASFGKQHHALDGRVFDHVEGIGERDQAVGCLAYREPYDGDDYQQVQYPGPVKWILAGRYPQGPESRCEYKVVDRCINWLEQRDADQPFFLRASFPGPHTPVTPPQPFDQLIDDEAIKLPPEGETLPEPCPDSIAKKLAATHTASVLDAEQIKRMRRHYYGNVAFLDQQFGRLLDWMDRKGLLDNTIIVFNSDHGTHLGDYNLVQKESFFEPVVNVPFFLALPGSMTAERGRTIKTPLSAMSLMPTLLDLAGLELPEGLEAPSLASVVRGGKAPDARPIFSEISRGGPHPFFARNNIPLPESMANKTHHAMVREGRWKFMMTLEAGAEEYALFDLEADPYERRNLAADAAHAQTCARLAEAIREAQ